MTVAISLKVNDGIVLAADSATTMLNFDPVTGHPVASYVYNNANKVFNLFKGLPVGLIMWGLGSIGRSSISTLVKDFRDEYSAKINPDSYTIESIAKDFKRFIYDSRVASYPASVGRDSYILGFTVAGYSTNEHFAEEWRIDITGNGCADPYPVRPKEASGVAWNGESEALFRFIRGYSQFLPNVLTMVGIDAAKSTEIITHCNNNLLAPLIVDAMPIQDAIDLAVFLVNVTIGYSKFTPGAQTVGGPIEVATITRHEHYKWIKRKHYFGNELNPGKSYADFNRHSEPRE
jgi:hypothetical protein